MSVIQIELKPRLQVSEDAMSTFSFAAEQNAKATLRPSRQAIRRAALALAVVLGLTGSAYFV
jgi:hypothetical protein